MKLPISPNKQISSRKYKSCPKKSSELNLNTLGDQRTKHCPLNLTLRAVN